MKNGWRQAFTLEDAVCQLGYRRAITRDHLVYLATGLWAGLDELRVNWGVDRVFEPQWDEARREEAYAGWKRAVERSQGWVQG